MKKRSILSCFVMACLALHLAAGSARPSAKDTTSGDGYVRFDARTSTWTLGTAMVEQRIELAKGVFALTGFENKLGHRQYVSEATRGEEFRVVVDGKEYTGLSGGWRLVGRDTSVLSQGEIQLVVCLENDLLRVEKTYVVYPSTSIIRQRVKFQNRSSSPITVSNPYFLADRLRAGEAARLTLNYMTGGGFFTGSQTLKEVWLSKDYARTFESKGKTLSTYYAPYLEMTDASDGGEGSAELAGINLNGGYVVPYASGMYMPWFCLRDVQAGDGVFAGFDYLGRWAGEIGNYYGGPGYLGLRLGGFKQVLAPGESIETPKAFTGVFTGDLDSMGNQLKGWQYRYLWDYTNEDYFAKIRFLAEMRLRDTGVIYGGGTQDNWDYRLAVILHTTDVMRTVGADIVWQDAGWHDQIGDNDGPDLAAVKRYLSKQGMGLAVWWPLYSITSKQARVYRDHPEWRPPTDGRPWLIENLDLSRKEVIDYLQGQLDEKVAQWGDFQWRLDNPAVFPVNENETSLLSQYHNAMGLLQNFRRRHPSSSVDVCSGGGNYMGFETLRMSDVSQLTDGGTLYVQNYYSSYLFPPDKIDDWTEPWNFTWENARQNLTMAPAWMSDRGVFGGDPGLLLNDGMENLRRSFEIYHYLVQQGVAGRWSQVYHPRVEGDDPVFYFERLSQDGQRGAVILKHFLPGQVTVYPKGLSAEKSYDVRFEMSKRAMSRTGADLMENGVTLVNPAPGELIYLGLPNVPGSGNDRTPPSPPRNVRMRLGTYLGVTGVELEWEPSQDNNWLSHYVIYRDGEMIDKVAKGNYYFDHSDGDENLAVSYQVQAIDGDGNASGKIAAVAGEGGPLTYTAAGGFLAGKDYSYQGANGWSYEEWVGTSHTPMTWNAALGTMGLYAGAVGDVKAVVGASWQRPAVGGDAVRVFTLPYAGEVRITGSVHKDIYHTYGDGVRVKVLKNGEQIWPATGWQSIPAGDVSGKSLELKIPVQKGEKLYFVVNCNGDAADDDTVWNPQITYERLDGVMERAQREVVDDQSTRLQYTGRGWQAQGAPANGTGYLPGRIRGTLSVSGTTGDKVSYKFRGTGIEVFGSTGDDGGIATPSLDGKDVGRIDTFAPAQRSQWATVPPIRLWGVQGLPEGDHTLELTVTGDKNRDSRGTSIGIDAFVVLNGLGSSPLVQK